MPRTVLTAALALFLPAVAAAGPIQVRLTTSIHTLPGQDWIAQSIVAAGDTGTLSVDPATGPTLVSLMRLAPPDLPADDPGNPYRYGGTYYRSGHFTLNVTLTDMASGETGELSYGGRLHADYRYAGNDTYTASAYVWLGGAAVNTSVGGNLYTLNPQHGWYAHVDERGLFEVWVGGNAPAPLPEPGTLALTALGLTPVVLRVRRRFPS